MDEDEINVVTTAETTTTDSDLYGNLYGYPVGNGYIGRTESGKKMLFSCEQDYKEWMEERE